MPNDAFAATSTAITGVDVLEGTLRSRAGTQVTISDATGAIRVVDLANASIWRGAYGQKPSALQLGDDVLVRLDGGVPSSAWSNLTRVKGTVNGASGSTASVVVGQDAATVLGLDGAKWVDASANAIAPRQPSAGSWIDVIGLATSSGTVATLATYLSPTDLADSGAVSPSVAVVAAPLANYCTYTYSGKVTWYSCSGPRCSGGCNPGSSNGVAWPALDSGCSPCSFTCCNCSNTCLKQVHMSCGDTVNIIDACKSKSLGCVISDCGPNQNGLCATSACGKCKSTKLAPVADLTKASFTKFYDPATYGCFEGSAKVTILCPGCC
jgi:hypothetical protein